MKPAIKTGKSKFNKMIPISPPKKMKGGVGKMKKGC